MTLRDMLSKRNIDGKVYITDIREWVGVEFPQEKLRELQDLLTEIANGND